MCRLNNRLTAVLSSYGSHRAQYRHVRTTAYFRIRVQRDRPEITLAMVQWVLENAERTAVQSDGRIRYWARIDELGGRALRVVTLRDGTVHNAFLDRRYRGQAQ